VVQGVVLDEESGNPLAQTVVHLIPLPGSKTAGVSIPAGERGAFTINNVRPGWYVLRCTRRGFVPAEVGQLRAGRPGMPFEITAEAKSAFFQVRMRRLGAITGSVLDENGVGIPDWTVHVFTARKPVKRVAEAKTDDRGNYRVGELEAASYVVRSAAGSLEDDSWLGPTFYKYGSALESAESVRVRVGETQPDVVIRPAKGFTFQLSGMFVSPTPATLMFITDVGRLVLVSSPGSPPGLPTPFNVTVTPGPVEFLAEGARCGSDTRIFADRRMQGIRITCGPLATPTVSWAGDEVRQQFPLTMRRVDLDGTGPVVPFPHGGAVVPGHWEIHAEVGSDYYVRSIASSPDGRDETAADGWFGLDVEAASQIVVTLSHKPASVSGTVKSAGDPVAGASVYLELIDAGVRVRLIEGRSDEQGRYRFGGLAPGSYRVLSSFDFDPEDRLAMEKAPVFVLNEGDAAVQALELALP
jgi:hypothetical protein